MATPRILIVEDQREVSRLLKTSLQTLEHKLDIIEMPSGEEAILDSSRNRIDLLVADYRLPGISGIELMYKVRGSHPEVKVILITGLTDPKVRREVADAGADAFFIKPVQIADFLDAVERTLGLVETILPIAPIAPPDEDEGEVKRTLPDLLAGLRQELAAQTVILFDDGGRVLARAGDLPDNSAEVTLTVSLMSIFSAGQKVASLVAQKKVSSWHVFDGGEYDLIFAPLDPTHSMLVMGKGLADEGKVLTTVNTFSAARETIEQSLSGVSVPRAEGARPGDAPVAGAAPEVEPEDIEPLFKTKKKLKQEELDAFWSEAIDKSKAPTKPDMLSYDQAKQLGLAPEGDK
ncbi:MAG: response regulator [Anaerolineales bacterium]|nr:response regulator [Anaerolineales bacterium]